MLVSPSSRWSRRFSLFPGTAIGLQLLTRFNPTTVSRPGLVALAKSGKDVLLCSRDPSIHNDRDDPNFPIQRTQTIGEPELIEDKLKLQKITVPIY